MAAAAPLKIGRYVLHREIASGGMASVHFGQLVATGGFTKTVAIKRLHRAFARHATLKESILEEARLASRIRHPNVVPPLDVVSEKGELLLVMEYVHGESLSKLMRASRNAAEPIAVPISASIMTNVLHGLHAAHEARDEKGTPLDIVHRDVSPQNILVGLDGVARVIDFGIAKAVTSNENTSTGTIKGKVPYLAPEQLEGEPATRRTDIYAASVVFWEVLAGKRLFDASEDPETLRQILQMDVPAPSAYNRNVPPAIDQIILRGIARSPADRYPTAREMALELEREVHLSTPTQVGAWAERLAGDSLAVRAAILAEVEAADRPKSSRPPPPDGILDSTVQAPAALIVPKMPSLPKLEVAPIETPRSQPSMPQPEPSRFPSAGALRKPELEIPNVSWLPHPTTTTDPKTETPASLRFFGVIGLIVVVLAALIWVLLPTLVQQRLVSDASASGVTLTIERIDVSRSKVHLVGVKARAADLPQVTVDADVVDLTLQAFTPVGLTFEGLAIAANGTHADVIARLDRFRAGKGKALEKSITDFRTIEIVGGKLEWKNVFGPGSNAVAENFRLDRNGDDAHLGVPLLTLRAGTASAGAWNLDVDRNLMFTRAVLRLDPSGTYQTTVTFTFAQDGGVEVVFGIPPTALSDLHLPPSVVGGMATERTRLGITGTFNLVSAEGTTQRGAGGHLFASATALTPIANGPAFDALLDVEFKGDSGKTIPVRNASLSLTSPEVVAVKPAPVATAKIAGGIDVGTTRTAFDLAGKTSPMACASTRGDVSLRVLFSAALDRLADAKVLFEPTSSCIPRLK
jgi:serine/threonine-protein kinase